MPSGSCMYSEPLSTRLSFAGRRFSNKDEVSQFRHDVCSALGLDGSKHDLLNINQHSLCSLDITMEEVTASQKPNQGKKSRRNNPMSYELWHVGHKIKYSTGSKRKELLKLERKLLHAHRFKVLCDVHSKKKVKKTNSCIKSLIVDGRSTCDRTEWKQLFHD